MSLFGALNSSVTGLKAQSDALGIISDNISNVNTNGFKANKANFQSLVTSAATQTSFNPGGVQLRPTQEVAEQGILDSSDIQTDLAIDGNGLFAVKDSAGDTDANPLKYTRAGSFRVNNDGLLENANGKILQGWRLSDDGNGNLVPPADQESPESVEDVKVNNFSGIARATENLDIGAQLPPNLDPNETRSLSARVFDSEGTPHNLDFQFTRNDGRGNELSNNKFRVEISAPTRSNDNSGLHAALFSNGNVDIGSIERGESNAVSRVISEVKQAAADQATGGAPGSQTTFSLDGVEMRLSRASGSNFEDASGTPVNLDDLEVADLNNTEDDLQLEVSQDGTTGGPFTALNTPPGTTLDDIALDQLITNTRVNGIGTNDAVTLDEVNGSGEASVATVNLLGTSVQARLNADENAATPVLQDGSGTANLTAGANGISLVNNNAGQDSRVDSIAVNRDGDATINEKDDLVLRGTTNGTTFEQTNRVATVVQFQDGGIKSIGDPAFNGDVTNDTPYLAGNSDGGLNLGLDFTQRDLSIPEGTDVTEPQDIALNLGTPTDLNLNEDNNIDPSEAGVNDKALDGLTSFENPNGFSAGPIEQDGLQFGNFTGVGVDEEGLVQAQFSNGERRDIFKIPVVTFNNPNGLEGQSGTIFAETPESGEAQLREAGIGGAGSIAPAALESSTVDLATEFTKMIETQRAYSASTRVVTTSDELLQEITNATR